MKRPRGLRRGLEFELEGFDNDSAAFWTSNKRDGDVDCGGVEVPMREDGEPSRLGSLDRLPANVGGLVPSECGGSSTVEILGVSLGSDM